jgi:uncharacterized protein
MNASVPLIQWVDYRRLASQRDTIVGQLHLGALPRVVAATLDAADSQRPVEVELALAEDSQRRVRISGRARTRLSLRCQRCLRPFSATLAPAVAGVVVIDDAAAADLPRADEPILAAGDRLDVYALIADELLLALPIVARCHRHDCCARYDQPLADESEAAEEKSNPFAVLQTLKRDD